MVAPRLTCAIALAVGSATAQSTVPEFGAVAWQRDFATAKQSARQAHKPVLLLFQEVPG